MNHMHFGRHHGKMHAFTAVLMLTAVFLTASTAKAPLTLADYNHSAHGVVNYCTIANGVTTIHGWVHDPDAPAGNLPTATVTVGTSTQTVNSGVSNYHDSLINSYLNKEWPTMPTSKIYGYVASFSGLYQGTAYAVSVTANNYGVGSSNVTRKDTVSVNYDGITGPNLLNADGTLPNSCLNPKPVTPTPTPTPTPSPTPTPTGGGSSGGGQSGGSSSSVGSSTSSGVNSPADGSVAAGTLNALVSVPSDGAVSAYVLYGDSPDNLGSSSNSADLSSGSANIDLEGLQPKTDYYYQIVRQDSSGATGTSTTAGFKTSGYTITLHFIDQNSKPISGIAGALDDADKTSAKSNKDGNLIFGNLDAGQYTVTYHYGKLNYTKSFDTDNAGDGSSNPGKTLELKDTVNVSKLTGGSTVGYTGPKHHSVWGVVLLILLLIIAGAGAILWWLRRRNAALYGAYSPAASYSLTPDIVDKPTPAAAPHIPKKRKGDVEPQQLEHVGESLRDMVIQSMHEEVQKRRTNRP